MGFTLFVCSASQHLRRVLWGQNVAAVFVKGRWLLISRLELSNSSPLKCCHFSLLCHLILQSYKLGFSQGLQMLVGVLDNLWNLSTREPPNKPSHSPVIWWWHYPIVNFSSARGYTNKISAGTSPPHAIAVLSRRATAWTILWGGREAQQQQIYHSNIERSKFTISYL